MDPIRNIIKVRVNNQDYLYQYENRPVIDMFKASGSDGIYNGFVYFFP